MRKMKISKRSAELAQQIVQRVRPLDAFDARALAVELNGGVMDRTWGIALWVARQVLNAAGRLYVPRKGAYVYGLATPKDRLRTTRNMLRAAQNKVGRAPSMLPASADVPAQLRRSYDRLADTLAHPVEMVALGLEHARAMLALPDDTTLMLKASKD